jgi:hypothetical protein
MELLIAYQDTIDMKQNQLTTIHEVQTFQQMNLIDKQNKIE